MKFPTDPEHITTVIITVWWPDITVMTSVCRRRTSTITSLPRRHQAYLLLWHIQSVSCLWQHVLFISFVLLLIIIIMYNYYNYSDCADWFLSLRLSSILYFMLNVQFLNTNCLLFSMYTSCFWLNNKIVAYDVHLMTVDSCGLFLLTV